MSERIHSPQEETANALSHGAGLLGALAGAPFLIGSALDRGDDLNVAAAGIFAAAMILVYLASTVYHALPDGRLKESFHILDHCAIFLLIAGTYTPFTMGVLRGDTGWLLLGLVWTLAVAGIGFKLAGGLRHPRLCIGLYLLMGWLVLLVARSLWLKMSSPGLAWLAAGSLAYTVGVVFHQAHAMRFNHAVWHLCTVVGTACHYFAVLWHSATPEFDLQLSAGG